MLDIAFADAARPARRSILNLLMAEYSLGHELLLLQIRNPLCGSESEFIKLPIEIQIQAIISAALICSKTWGENGKRDRWFWLFQWKNRNANYPLAIADFRNYRDSGSTFPPTLPPETEGRTLGAPYLSRLSAFAFSAFGPLAMDMPLGLVQWCYFATCEEEGGLRIPNAGETETLSEVARLEAEIEAEHAAKRKGESWG